MFLVLLLLLIINPSNSSEVVQNILVFGGNGLVGSATVSAILSSKFSSIFNLTLVSRGNWYWDTADIIKPFVRHISCERGDAFKTNCPLKNDRVFYDTIIDFSCYDPLDIEDVLIILEGRFRNYIYISSDSVYEVSIPKQHSGYLREEDAIRPADDRYASLDRYGHRKLQGEETLEKYRKMLNYKYIALRLPDVIGPRDNTNRVWKFYLQSKLNNIMEPISISHSINKQKLSFVYSKDVGKLIFDILLKHSNNDQVWNQAYNVAFDEVLTLKGFYESIGKYLNANLTIQLTEDRHISMGFPSVTKGAVSNEKVKRVFNEWVPTEFQDAITETCKFYEAAQYNTAYKFRLDMILNALDVRGYKYRDFLKMHQEALQQLKKYEL